MSESKYSVTLGQIIKEFDLEVLCAAPNYEEVPLHTVDVNRPGLPLSGFFEHFDTKRLLLMGLSLIFILIIHLIGRKGAKARG